MGGAKGEADWGDAWRMLSRCAWSRRLVKAVTGGGRLTASSAGRNCDVTDAADADDEADVGLIGVRFNANGCCDAPRTARACNTWDESINCLARTPW